MESVIFEIFKKALEDSATSNSYSPQQIKQMLDTHQTAILFILRVAMWAVVIITVFYIVNITLNECRYRKLQKKLKKIEKVLDKNYRQD